MKLVFGLGNCGLEDEKMFLDFARAAGELLADGHRLTVLHGGTRVLIKKITGLDSDSPNASKPLSQRRNLSLMILSAKINRKLAAILAHARIAAFGLCASDGNIVRTRIGGCQGQFDCLEVANFDPFWIETIAGNGAVPVLTNIALRPDGQYDFVNLDQMAAACAIAWGADALVFLTRSQGVRTSNGSVLRWLNSKEIDMAAGETQLTDAMRSKLNACHHALKHGVRRARVFPLAEASKLSLLYVSGVAAGTEVILS